MESFGDRNRRFSQVLISADDEHICCIGGTSVSVDEFKSFAGVIATIRIGTTPASLLQNKNKPVVILKNWMIDFSLLDPTRVHFISTGRTVMSDWFGFKKESFSLPLDLNIRNCYISIFKVK